MNATSTMTSVELIITNNIQCNHSLILVGTFTIVSKYYTRVIYKIYKTEKSSNSIDFKC